MSNTLTAEVHDILPIQTFDSGFTKQVLVLKTTGEYPETIPFEFWKDKTELLNNVSKGQLVTVHYNLKGNEYRGKYYANLQGWKIDTEQDGNAVIANAASEKAKQQEPIDDVDGPLPF